MSNRRYSRYLAAEAERASNSSSSSSQNLEMNNSHYLRNLVGTSERASDSNMEFSYPVFASGGFEVSFGKGPFEIDKSFGLIKDDNSVYKFRIVFKSSGFTMASSKVVAMTLIYLGEPSIDCRISIGKGEHNQEVIKNMSVYKTTFIIEKDKIIRRIFIEVGQDPDASNVTTCFANKFNDRYSSDFMVKCKDKVFFLFIK